MSSSAGRARRRPWTPPTWTPSRTRSIERHRPELAAGLDAAALRAEPHRPELAAAWMPPDWMPYSD